MVETPSLSAQRGIPVGEHVSRRVSAAVPRLLWPPGPSRLLVRRGETHVWAIVLVPEPRGSDYHRAALSLEEQARADRFHFERDRVRYIVAHATLRRLLARCLGVEPASLTFSTGAKGKPFLAGPGASAELHFNLSHSANVALVAVSADGPVGVDVESLRPVPDASDLVARFFSPRERELFDRLAEKEQCAGFYRLWTRKEAWLKATGEGISELPHLVEVSSLSGPAPLAALPPMAERLGSWRLQSLEPARGFIGAVAVPVSSETVCCWVWKEDDA